MGICVDVAFNWVMYVVSFADGIRNAFKVVNWSLPQTPNATSSTMRGSRSAVVVRVAIVSSIPFTPLFRLLSVN